MASIRRCANQLCRFGAWEREDQAAIGSCEVAGEGGGFHPETARRCEGVVAGETDWERRSEAHKVVP
jgi:hypothetical protein